MENNHFNGMSSWTDEEPILYSIDKRALHFSSHLRNERPATAPSPTRHQCIVLYSSNSSHRISRSKAKWTWYVLVLPDLVQHVLQM